jgi:hypothetical protein
MSLQPPQPQSHEVTRRSGSSNRDLPRMALPDVLHVRDAAWLDEMKAKLAAVEAWRGVRTHHSRKYTAS